MFWLISLVLLVAAGILTAWPLLAGGARGRLVTVLSVVLVAPLLTYWLYITVGAPQALRTAEPAVAGEIADMDDLTATLRGRLRETPEDLEGWILLARSYKSMQRHPEALEALEIANRLVPDQPMVMVELVEARLFTSGDPTITAEMTATLEQAVQADPSLQKGLWLLGIAAAQRGDDTGALAWWQQLLAQLEPDSPVAESVQEQIAQVRERAGAAAIAPARAPAALTEPASLLAEPGSLLDVQVDVGDAARQALQSGSGQPILFVIVREADMPGGPPLGVRRFDGPDLPLALRLTDADSMMPQRPISSAATVDVQARLSFSGSPTAVSGDWQSAVISAPSPSAGTVNLLIDQIVE